MSLIPLINALLLAILLVSIFCWKLSAFWLTVVVALCVVFKVCFYIFGNNFHQGSAFWLFIISEVFVFGSLLYSCLACDSLSLCSNISSFIEAPFIGCFMLLGSSLTATTFHHNLGLRGMRGWLFLTIGLGLGFILLQVYEFRMTVINWSDSFYYSCCFTVVGLHCTHVIIGLSGLMYFGTFVNELDRGLQDYYANIVVWYWHFVDFIWLIVYFIVYLC